VSGLVKILRRVEAGESTFEPVDHTYEAMLKFQPTARALWHALKEELIERCVFKRESFKGRLLFTGAYVVQGLTYKGDRFLEREGTFRGQLSSYMPSTLKWVSGIVAGVLLAALVRWLIG